jgi:hypothetical protein
VTVDVDTAQIHRWAEDDAEEGTKLSAWHRYPGMGFDPETGDLIDWSGEWRTRDLVDMLDNDGIARAAEQALTLPLRGAPLTVKPAPGDSGEAKLCNDTFDALADPIEDTIGQAAQSLIFRMTFLEKLWTVRDGRTTYSGLAWRPTDSCAPTRNPGTGSLTGFKQQMTWWGVRTIPTGMRPGMWVTIPNGKGVVFVHGRARDPINGVSELTTGWQAYQTKQKIKFLWSVFLKGASIQRVIAKTQDGQQDAVAATLSKLAAGGVAAFPTNLVSDLTILNATDSGQFFKEALAYYDNELLSSVLAGFLGLAGAAATGRGSFALSKDQSDFFLQAQDAAAREIASTVKAQIIRPLCVVNFGPAAVVPHVQLGPVSRATAQEQMDFLKGLAAGQGQDGAAGGSAKGLVPQEFIDELVVKIAGYLDLDVDKVVAAIKAAPSAPVAPVATAVDKATEIVQRAHSGLDPLAA